MIRYLNKLEEWLKATKSEYHLFPVRMAGYLFLGVALAISNLVAIIRWPISLLRQKSMPRKTGSRNNTATHFIKEADEKQLEDVLENQTLVLVDFWAAWCGVDLAL